jgi:hypothetical protein
MSFSTQQIHLTASGLHAADEIYTTIVFFHRLDQGGPTRMLVIFCNRGKRGSDFFNLT